MKRILITGASGFLGSRCVQFFQNRYAVYAPGHIEMDITDLESVIKCVYSFQPDVILHCAAISDVGRCEKEPQLSWDINVTGSVNVARAAAAIKAKCILCSSDQIYFGSNVPGPHKESEEVTPVNLYGREKMQAEKACLKINPDCVLLRLTWMYDNKTIHASEHSDFLRTFIPKYQNGESFYFPVYDVRGITDVNEVIGNLEKAFELAGGVYNFGSPNDMNTYDAMYTVFEELGLDIGRIQKNEEAFQENPRDISMCIEKLGDIKFSTTVEGLVRNIARVIK